MTPVSSNTSMSSRTHGDGTTVFKHQIQKDPDVCNNCFRRTHETVERNYAKRTFVNDENEPDVYWEKVDFPDMRFTRQDEVDTMYSDRDDGTTVRSCKCGLRNIPLRPISLDSAMTRAKRVAKRLYEAGVMIDHDVLLDVVREEMQKPENQGRFDTVLDGAVSEAIRAWNLKRSSDASTGETL